MLEDSKQALLDTAKKTLMEESSFDTDDLPDEIDQASSEYAQSMVFRLRDREKFLLQKIEKALQRIEDGTFGICERCEEDISPKRLEARPGKTLCIRCKEEQEMKKSSYGSPRAPDLNRPGLLLDKKGRARGASSALDLDPQELAADEQLIAIVEVAR